MTSTRRQIRRDTSANLNAATPADGEMGYDQSNKRLVVGDGVTQGGVPQASYRDVQNNVFIGAVAGGTANALTISTAKNPSTLVDLQSVRVKIATTNTGTATLQWGVLPATAIKKYLGTSKVDLVAGDLLAGKIVHFDFDGTDFVLFSEGSGGVPAGVVADFAGSTAPNGWLMCFGQAVSRTTYADLWNAIGVTYGGGNGTSTFNLPDCRGRVIAGKDNMGGTSADRLTNFAGGVDGDVLGSVGGAEAHTLTTGEMPSHSHNIQRFTTTNSASDIATTNGWSNSPVTIKTTTSAGGGGAHNNLQPTLILNKIIKT